MKEEYSKIKERETCLIDEVDKQKKKILFYENKYNSYSSKSTKGNFTVCLPILKSEAASTLDYLLF